MEIVGISFDTSEDNRAFAEQNGFPFRLLSDVQRRVGSLYETLRGPQESNPDQAKRRTYLIDPEGVIRKAYRVTDIPAHAEQVLEDVRRLSAWAEG